MANFDSEFFGLVFPEVQATQKMHALNSRPELSAFLSNFTFLNPKFIHGDFLLTENAPKFSKKFSQPAPKYHTKGCSRSSVDSPGARTLVFVAFEPFSMSTNFGRQ